MKISIPLDFGDKVKNIINGFEGRVDGFAVYPTGCVHVEVLPQKLNKESGEPVKARWYDIKYLKKVPKTSRVKLLTPKVEGLGKSADGGPGRSKPSSKVPR